MPLDLKPTVMRLTLSILAFIFSVSVSNATNQIHPLVSVSDVISLISQFLDFTHLFQFKNVCQMFNIHAKTALSARFNQFNHHFQQSMEYAHLNRLLVCKSEKDFNEKTNFYSRMNHHRITLLKFRKKYLLIRGISVFDDTPKYNGRVIVINRLKCPFNHLSSLLNNINGDNWIWNDRKNEAFNFLSGKLLRHDHPILAILLPFFVAENDGYLELYRIFTINDNQSSQQCIAKIHDVQSQVDSDLHSMRLSLAENTSDPHQKSENYKGWPILMVNTRHSSALHIIVDFESGTIKDHWYPDHHHHEIRVCSWFNHHCSHSTSAIIAISNDHQWQCANLMNDQIICESAIPNDDSFEQRQTFESMMNEESLVYYDYSVNERYALISPGFDALITIKDGNHRTFLFDICTAAMIGPSLESPGMWVSDELFKFSNNAGIVKLRSVHQTGQDIECMLVDERGNEQPMLETDYQMLGNNAIYDRRSNEILTVEFEKQNDDEDDEPARKKRRQLNQYLN